MNEKLDYISSLLDKRNITAADSSNTTARVLPMTTAEMITYDLRNYTSVNDPGVKELLEEFCATTLVELKASMINEAHHLTADEFIELREEAHQPTKKLVITILH